MFVVSRLRVPGPSPGVPLASLAGPRALASLVAVAALGCAASGAPGVSGPTTAAPGGAWLLPEETTFLADLRQLTFGGENAEAYFAFDGRELSFQARREGEGCDRIYRLPLAGATPTSPVPVSSGKGATTCAHFFPTGDLLYASTHLAGDACPPRPDMSQGYVWPVHDSYDIFRSAPDGSGLRRLTSEKGYDAEGTVCARDGSVIFTSARDGDLELYRMDADGKNVKRLTRTPGYDGGAFFNRDCTRIVWRASRPLPGKELDDYRALLAQGLVRPSRLELWIADADGGNPMQLTYLGAASFAPFFHPVDNVVLFSSNTGDPRGREFDLWAVRTDGTGLTRITRAPGFDGFPHFSPDGKLLAFSSNRATAPGRHDTNVFLARWLGLPAQPTRQAAHDTSADRIGRDVSWLADPAREGRGIATRGLARAGEFLEEQLRGLGLAPGGDDGSFRHHFPVTTKVEMAPASRLEISARPVARTDFSILGFSRPSRTEGSLVLAGYGIVDEKLGLDDYRGLDVKDKVVLVRRFAPEGDKLKEPSVRTRLGDIRRKAWLARERGASALLVVDWPVAPVPPPPDWKPPAEAALRQPAPEGSGDAGIPVMMVKRAAIEPVMPRLTARQPVPVVLDAALTFHKADAFNVAGRIPAGQSPHRGTLIIGAHYDHLGLGGPGSLAPDKREPHPGADDNASGTATVLEIARSLMARRAQLSRDVLVMFFSGEEAGLLGSTQYARTHAAILGESIAMLNLDMVGRLRGNRVEVLGSETAGEWKGIVTGACTAEAMACATEGDGSGFGASDQASFYSAGLPVLHFFTGTHADYHKPSDVAARINAAGAAAVARLVERVAVALDAQPRLTFRKGATVQLSGDSRSFSASLGTIPDYAGPPGGAPGVLLSGVRPGGAAEKAGLRRGDILVRLGTHEIRSVQDLVYALNAFKPGETASASLVRDGKEVKLEVTFQESTRTMR